MFYVTYIYAPSCYFSLFYRWSISHQKRRTEEYFKNYMLPFEPAIIIKMVSLFHSVYLLMLNELVANLLSCWCSAVCIVQWMFRQKNIFIYSLTYKRSACNRKSRIKNREKYFPLDSWCVWWIAVISIKMQGIDLIRYNICIILLNQKLVGWIT